MGIFIYKTSHSNKLKIKRILFVLSFIFCVAALAMENDQSVPRDLSLLASDINPSTREIKDGQEQSDWRLEDLPFLCQQKLFFGNSVKLHELYKSKNCVDIKSIINDPIEKRALKKGPLFFNILRCLDQLIECDAEKYKNDIDFHEMQYQTRFSEFDRLYARYKSKIPNYEDAKNRYKNRILKEQAKKNKALNLAHWQAVKKNLNIDFITSYLNDYTLAGAQFKKRSKDVLHLLDTKLKRKTLKPILSYAAMHDYRRLEELYRIKLQLKQGISNQQGSYKNALYEMLIGQYDLFINAYTGKLSRDLNKKNNIPQSVRSIGDTIIKQWQEVKDIIEVADLIDQAYKQYESDASLSNKDNLSKLLSIKLNRLWRAQDELSSQIQDLKPQKHKKSHIEIRWYKKFFTWQHINIKSLLSSIKSSFSRLFKW